MALPKSKYSEPKHTPGKEFSLNGVEYVGWYVITYQDKFFTGKVLDKNSKQLIPISNTVPINSAVFVEQKVQPTKEDRLKGVWERYLIQNRKNRVIIEVTKERYDLFKNKSNTSRITLNWVIKGPSENIIKKSYIYYGAEFKNKQTVELLESKVPGINNFFKSYSEFVE